MNNLSNGGSSNQFKNTLGMGRGKSFGKMEVSAFRFLNLCCQI